MKPFTALIVPFRLDVSLCATALAFSRSVQHITCCAIETSERTKFSGRTIRSRKSSGRNINCRKVCGQTVWCRFRGIGIAFNSRDVTNYMTRGLFIRQKRLGPGLAIVTCHSYTTSPFHLTGGPTTLNIRFAPSIQTAGEPGSVERKKRAISTQVKQKMTACIHP